jgi:DNA-directed RNA polymerase specialized sigma24 family protein
MKTEERMPDTDSLADDRIDERLLAAISTGSEQAFVDLYRRRHNDVYRFVFAMARSRSFAQDVTQEVFLNVLENARRFDSAKSNPRAGPASSLTGMLRPKRHSCDGLWRVAQRRRAPAGTICDGSIPCVTAR